MDQSIAAKVREARLRKGISQVKLAAASGLTRETINRIERGVQANPNRSTLMLLELVLDAEPGSLRV